MATQGFAAAEVQQVYARAYALCQQLGETPQLFPARWGAWAFYDVRAESRTALELADQLFAVAQQTQDSAHLMQAHRALAQTLFSRGELVRAHSHAEYSIACYHPQQHRPHVFLYGQDSVTASLSYAAIVLELLGYSEQARQRLHQGLTLAQELAHPLSLSVTLIIAARLHALRGEHHAVRELAARLTSLATAHGFAQFVAAGTIMQGWSCAMQGQVVAGIGQMCQALAAYRLTGAQAGLPHYLALLGEAYGRAGQPDEGLSVVAAALDLTQQHGDHVYDAVLYRLRGELTLAYAHEPHTAAEACFRQALVVARQQQARSLELRAATSLARLWQQQGKGGAAHALLTEAYGWFTEGFDTVALQESGALLLTLGEAS